MANFTTNLTITTPKETTSATLSGNYTEVFSLSQVLDNNNGLYSILSNSASVGSLTLSDCKTLMIKNSGLVGAELNFLLRGWTAATPNAIGSPSYVSMLLASGEFIILPNLRVLVSTGTSESQADSLALDNQVPDANMYTDSGADTTEGFADDNDTTITFDDGSGSSAGHLFEVGDLIRLDNEVCRVIANSGTVFTVDRAVHGTAKADHTNNTEIRFPFFNTYADFDKYSTAQSDSSGRFKCNNFFGYGRAVLASAGGLVAGTISGKFYSQGFQELGLSGITSSTESGLTASTDYQFTIAVDGGSAYDADVTTGTNTKWGGSDGVIRKIQDVFDAAYYTAGNLFEKKVTVGIVNGDIRFTSGQHLSTSAIALGDSSGGDTDIWGVGRIPAVANVEGAVAARLPDDTITDKKTGVSLPNVGVFFYDDGKGNISGACSGTINYESGAIDLNGCPPNANFVVSANYGSAHSGGNKFESDDANSILQIQARSTNSKINTTIELIGIK